MIRFLGQAIKYFKFGEIRRDGSDPTDFIELGWNLKGISSVKWSIDGNRICRNRIGGGQFYLFVRDESKKVKTQISGEFDYWARIVSGLDKQTILTSGVSIRSSPGYFNVSTFERDSAASLPKHFSQIEFCKPRETVKQPNYGMEWSRRVCWCSLSEINSAVVGNVVSFPKLLCFIFSDTSVVFFFGYNSLLLLATFYLSNWFLIKFQLSMRY